MLEQVADGVHIHDSDFLQTKAIVVEGEAGVLLIDPGITRAEMADLADDLRKMGQPVIAGFSTHPDWDHTLWHPAFGDAPRYGTARGAESMRELLAKPGWKDLVARVLPPEIIDDIPMELLGELDGLPAGTVQVPWDGPRIRIIEHQAHAVGHAALVIEDSRVLVAGDMLSDILIPFLDLDAAEPVADYLAALDLLEGVADQVDVVIPGHGSVGRADDVRARIALDRAYAEALRDGRVPVDPRVGPSATFGTDWLPGIHEWQAGQLIG